MAGIAVGQTLIGKNNKDPYRNWARNCPAGPTPFFNGSTLI